MRPSKTLARSTFFNIITHARFLPRHLSSLSLFVQAVTTLFLPFLPFFLSSRSVGNLVTLCDATSKGRISLHLRLKLRQSCFWPLLFLALCPPFSVSFISRNNILDLGRSEKESISRVAFSTRPIHCNNSA